MADITIDTPSTDNSMGADTDVEGFILSEDWSVREYALGTAFFQFTLVANLVPSRDVDENWPEFDVRVTPSRICDFADNQKSKLALIKSQFPYKAILLNIQERFPREFWRNGTNDYEEFMVVLGAILRGGDANIQSWIAEIIKESGLYPHCQRSESKKETSMLPPKNGHTPDSVASGKHISSLKEYGDRVGEAPKYCEVEIQAQPPIFRSKLSFKGHTFQADGKSKKVARQNAAHKACGVFAVPTKNGSGAVIL